MYPVYENTWQWESVTSKGLTAFALSQSGYTIYDLMDRAREAAYVETVNHLAADAAEQGISITNISVVTEANWDFLKPPLYFGDPLAEYMITIRTVARFNSDQPPLGSPIADWMLTIINRIILAIVLLILGYFAIQAIKSFFESLVTTKSTITTHTIWYDDEGNPIKEEWKEEEIIEAKPMNVAIIAAVTVIGVLFFWNIFAHR